MKFIQPTRAVVALRVLTGTPRMISESVTADQQAGVPVFLWFDAYKDGRITRDAL